MFDSIKNVIMTILGIVAAVLFAVLGITKRKAQKERTKLEKKVDEQKKIVAAKKVEEANMQHDLEKLKLDGETDEKIKAVKKVIRQKRKEIKEDKNKLKEYTAELDRPIEGEGSIRKIQ